MDGRTETAYPPQVTADYSAFVSEPPGWERYWTVMRIDGVMIPNRTDARVMLDRFRKRRGWKKGVHRPANATIFLCAERRCIAIGA